MKKVLLKFADSILTNKELKVIKGGDYGGDDDGSTTNGTNTTCYCPVTGNTSHYYFAGCNIDYTPVNLFCPSGASCSCS